MTIQLYVGTYSKYNSGSIAGKWLDLEDYVDSEDFYTACKELHKNESDPEFMFQDYEGFPSFLYSECGNVDAIYEFIDLEDHEREIIELYDDTITDLQSVIDNYMGSYDSYADYAYEYIEMTGETIPAWLESHVDYESLGKDLTDNMSVFESNGQIHLFSY